MKETIIWTALPGKKIKQGTYLVSAYVTFHLSYTAGDLSSWGKATLSRFSTASSFKPENLKITVLQNGTAVKATQISAVSPGLFASLFPPSGPVVSYDPIKPTWKVVQTINSFAIYKHLEELYGDHAVRAFAPPRAMGELKVDEMLGKVAPHANIRTERKRKTTAAPKSAFSHARAMKEADLAHEPYVNLLRARAGGQLGQHSLDDFFVEAQNFHRPFVPIKEHFDLPKKPDIDFHDAFAMLGQHSQLMRMVGVVIDFEVEGLTGGNLTLKVDGMTDATYSVTAFTVTPDSCFAKPRTSAPGGGAFSSLLLDGFMHMPETKVGLGSMDLAGAVIQTTALAEKAMEMDIVKPPSPPPKSKGDVSKAVYNDIKGDGVFPTRQSSGITAYVQDHSSYFIKTNDVAQAILDSKFTEVLTGDDLLKGWRPDIQINGKWYSLTARQVFYRVGGQALANNLTDEGQVTSSTSGPPDDDTTVKIDEGAFTWDGWSLVAPKPIPPLVDRSIKDDTVPDTSYPTSVADARAKTSFNEDANYKLTSFAEPVAGSLPKLRFGLTYGMRARYVDLAGNSLPLDATTPAEAVQTTSYLRHEPITAPSSHIAQGVSPGESASVIAVRKDKSGQVLSTGTRFILPPPGGVNFAELHGMFDTPDGKVDATFYAKLAAIEGRPALDTILAGKPALPYLIDPACTGFTLRYRMRGAKPTDYASASFVGTGGWIGAEPGAVMVKPGAQLGLAGQGNQVTITLAPGQDVTLEMSSTTAERYLDAFNQTYWIEKALQAQGQSLGRVSREPRIIEMSKRATGHKPFGAEVRETTRVSIKWRPEDQPKSDAQTALESCLAGFNSALTPSRPVRFVYAVEVPEPGFKFEKTDVTRNAGTSATFDLSGKLHNWSTAEMELTVSYVDPVDDIGEPRRTTKTASRVAKIFDTKPYYGPTEPLAGWYATELLEFHDTKAHSVQLISVCKSRYPDFFPAPSRSPEDVRTNLRRIEGGRTVHMTVEDGVVGHYTKTYSKADIIVPSNKKPDPPYVEYVLPAMTWTTQSSGKSHASVMRGNTVRVYLRRPWFSSGVGEKLGVVLQEGGEPDSKWNSAIGFDPAYKYIDAALPLNPDHFINNAGVVPGTAYAETGGTATIITYDPVFDDAEQMWYVDVELNPSTPYYTPFVKLVLCRWQEHSTPGNQMSPVALTETSQFQPDRVAVVQVVDPGKNYNLFYTGAVGAGSLGLNYVVATLERQANHGPEAPWLEVTANDETVNFGVELDDGFFGFFGMIPDLYEWVQKEDGVNKIIQSASGTKIAVPDGQGPYRLVLREFESNGRLCHIDVVNLP